MGVQTGGAKYAGKESVKRLGLPTQGAESSLQSVIRSWLRVNVCLLSRRTKPLCIPPGLYGIIADANRGLGAERPSLLWRLAGGARRPSNDCFSIRTVPTRLRRPFVRPSETYLIGRAAVDSGGLQTGPLWNGHQEDDVLA